jgi:hypothetical protein
MFRVLASLVTTTLSAIAGLLLLYLLLTLSGPLPPTATDAIPPSTQSAQAQPVVPATTLQMVHAAILVTSTVGTNPHECASTDVITVTADTRVIYCYTIINTGDVTLTQHTISNANLGFAVPLSFTLAPPGGLISSFYFTVAVPVTSSLVNRIVWRATNETAEQAEAEDQAQVVVPAIALTHTVGTDPHTCAPTNYIRVPAGTSVTHCYWVANQGETTFHLHTLVDSRLGVLMADKPLRLAPKATTWVTATEWATASATSVSTWTATITDGLYAVAVDLARVRVPALLAHTTVSRDDAEPCAERVVITATVGDAVTYCYKAENTGGVELIDLVVQDSILDHEPFVLTETLPANSSLHFRVTAPVTQATTNTVTWTARTAEGLTVTATATAQLVPLARVRALAFYDVDRDGLWAPLEFGVSAMTVTLEAQGAAPRQAVTDERGWTDFPGLTNGIYTVTITTTELQPQYSVRAADRAQPILIQAPGIYTKTFPLFLPDETDSDGDGIPDYLEGVYDIDGDGIPRYLDADQYLFLPLVRQR